MTPPAIALVIFDCDGVLIDSESLSTAVLVEMLRARGIAIDRDYVLTHFIGHPYPVVAGKIAALGVKVSNHCTYHGVALNVAMDLAPFQRINPCGYAGLRTVDLATLGIRANPEVVAGQLAERLIQHLSR